MSGFAQSEEIVVSVFIPYCESGAEWEVVIDADAPERCPDLVPLPATEADASKVCWLPPLVVDCHVLPRMQCTQRCRSSGCEVVLVLSLEAARVVLGTFVLVYMS